MFTALGFHQIEQRPDYYFLKRADNMLFLRQAEAKIIVTLILDAHQYMFSVDSF